MEQPINTITNIAKAYEYDIGWTQNESIGKAICEDVISRLKECEIQVHNQLDGSTAKQQLAMKITGIILITLAAIAAAIAAVSFFMSLLPFTAILIIGGASAVTMITGIVLTILGCKKYNHAEEYLDNCPYYQGLTQILNGEYEKAINEFQKYTIDSTNLQNISFDNLDQLKFNTVNNSLTLVDPLNNAVHNEFDVAKFYFMISLSFRIRELCLINSKKELNEVEYKKTNRFVDNYNQIRVEAKYTDQVQSCFNNINDIMSKVLGKQKNDVKPEDNKNFIDLVIPSLKTTPQNFKISLRA